MEIRRPFHLQHPVEQELPLTNGIRIPQILHQEVRRFPLKQVPHSLLHRNQQLADIIIMELLQYQEVVAER